MTAVPSVSYPVMEVPAVEDSMEMASPYQGQADDFDIDIDFMEDHDNASNMDSDMMGAEEFTNASQPTEFNEAIHDADMADDPSEGSMIDADLVDPDNDIDVNITEETYEAEMIEDDPVEDVDIPVPTIQLEITAAEDTNKPIEVNETVSVMAEQQTPEGQQPLSVPTEPQEDQINPQVSEIQTLDTETGSTTENDSLAQNPTENGTHAETSEKHEAVNPTVNPAVEVNETGKPSVSVTDENHEAAEGFETSQVQSSIEQPQAAPLEEPQATSTVTEPAETQGQLEGESHAEHEEESLHPVKIYYQDNEIALFPPLEGDSAETFFLHDEDVAYENIGELFKALRLVLQGNVADNEVLVIDIDVLGIQMTEDSFHTSQVTLHQVVDLYLRLCHNDGTADAEALYLTLSSKRAFPAEIADLLDAANEGKGLSGIHPWDEFDEYDPGSEDDIETHETERHENGSSSEEAQPEHSEPEAKLAPSSEEQAPVDAASQPKEDRSNVAQTKDLAPEDTKPDTAQDESNGVLQADDLQGQVEGKETDEPDELEHFEGEHAQEDDLHNDDQAENYDDENEDHYDSEGQQSESTATVAPLSAEAEVTEQTEEVSTDPAAVHHDQHDGENDEVNADYYNDEDNSYGDQENFQDEVTGEDINAGAQTLAGDATGPDEEEDELDAAPTDEVVSTDAFNNEGDQTFDYPVEPTSNGAQQDASYTEQTRDHADDLLEIAPDVLQSPAKHTENEPLYHIEGVDSGELVDELAYDGVTDEQHFNEDNFGEHDPHLEDSEAVVLAEADPLVPDAESSAPLSAKRSREDADDDEWDLVETTVDTKRRRSS
ncbi:uncharacterized protein N7511_008791 [Penicillium nucicola]|uniref:uncharacterized protein n=1 Tax=Penicillium nucicola TaxID=1850975 RepID=UPI002545099D|nr:uncharacterized protein N7511_008791 [Penicillium nucicola]KAJ5747095.1 hypothetical protein N7511_008791 [Penicillium nucicola]